MIDLVNILELAGSNWKACALRRESRRLSDQGEALAAWLADFDFEAALAVFQSGARLLLQGARPPVDLGAILHLEGYAGTQTRILRHRHGRDWRLTILAEEKGASHAREPLEILGDGPASRRRLAYDRFWSLDDLGLWRPEAVRLAGVSKADAQETKP